MSLPTITLEGRLAADPELRFTAAGKAVCGFRVIASESKKDDAGNWQDGDRIGLNVSVWDRPAEEAAEHLRKGMPVIVTGRLYEREYDKKDGTKGRSLEVKYATVAKVLTPPRGTAPAPSAPAPAWGQPAVAAPAWGNPTDEPAF